MHPAHTPSSVAAALAAETLTTQSPGVVSLIGRVLKFGDADNVGADSDVWPLKTRDQWIFASAGTLSCVSDDVADTGELTLSGYDAAGKELSETVTLTGTTPVVTSAAFSFCLPRASYNTGSFPNAAVNETNMGNITVSRGGVGVAYIDATRGQSLQAFYRIPATLADDTVVDHAVVYGWSAGSGNADEVIVEIDTATPGTSWRTRERVRTVGNHDTGSMWSAPENPIVGITLPPGSLVKAHASEVGNNNGRVAARFFVALFGA